MMTRWQWMLQQLLSKLWVRAAIFCVLAIATALCAYYFKHYIPSDLPRKVGARSVDNILQIIAASMLAVTTFSLNIMVAANVAASNSATPRARSLLLEDSTAQNALSTFIGSFLFSLAGIIALSMGIYGNNGRLILLVVTVLVIMLIVVTLLRWIQHLSRMGGVAHTVDIVEQATSRALKNRMENPFLSGKPLKEDFKPTSSMTAVSMPGVVGYIQHIDMKALSEIAEEIDKDIIVASLPGSFCDTHRALAYVKGKVDEEISAEIRDAFIVSDERSFRQDPRYGLIVLSEIASRALSPAVNDPGTAIDVIGSAVRCLHLWTVEPETALEKPAYPRIHVPSLTEKDMLEDIFSPIERDGAAVGEVCIRLQKAFASLAEMGDGRFKKEATHHSKLLVKRCKKAMPLTEEQKIIEALALA